MNAFLSELTNSTIQIIAFTIIPLFTYLVTKKKHKGFFNYLGIKKTSKKAIIIATLSSFIFVTIAFIPFYNNEFKEIMIDPNTIAGKFKQMGFSLPTILVLLVVAIFKTSFAEELFFRGFVAKRLIAILGYEKGNILQSIIFGSIHVLIFLLITNNTFFLIFSFIYPATLAYWILYLNEKKSNGSIIPGWVLHGIANTSTYLIIGFII